MSTHQRQPASKEVGQTNPPVKCANTETTRTNQAVDSLVRGLEMLGTPAQRLDLPECTDPIRRLELAIASLEDSDRQVALNVLELRLKALGIQEGKLEQTLHIMDEALRVIGCGVFSDQQWRVINSLISGCKDAETRRRIALLTLERQKRNQAAADSRAKIPYAVFVEAWNNAPGGTNREKAAHVAATFGDSIDNVVRRERDLRSKGKM